MKKYFSVIVTFILIILAGCSNCGKTKAIELMGAGDRIHDTYTFANQGVKIEETSENVYLISGSVERIESIAVKEEFKIDEDVNHVVAIKLSAEDCKVDKDNVQISVNGIRAYDAEHLNGSDYTFIILEAAPGGTVSISVNWNGTKEFTYVINFSEDIVLK